ncbi:MAG TPA: D-2-hydroxyacid dehydrogenase [Pedobacter sp.]|jgi:glycerate dehydrogenase
MNIVVTDGFTLNPGDLSWDEIHALGKVTLYDRTPTESIIERCKDADIILTNKVPFSREVLEKLTRTKVINVTATGYNIIDTKAANELEIQVCNVPAYGTASVAQHVFAMMLELTSHVGLNANATAEGKWENCADFCFTEKPIMEIAGKTLGIVGLGHIGEQVARIANAFDMKVLYNSRSPKTTQQAAYRDLNALFAESDFVSLHCPLTPENKEFVNKELISKMKPTSYLINTARGQLINEQDLADALNENIIAGAALDVLSVEPPPSTNPLLKVSNCLITPHTAWISKEARVRIMMITAQNIKAFLDGKPINGVS